MAGPSQAAEAPAWVLQRVHISALDEQHLFELQVRMQHASDEEAMLTALQELAGAAVGDFPPAALLQRAPLLDACLAAMRGDGGGGDAGAAASADAGGVASLAARRLAFDTMQRLITRIKEALLDAEDACMCPAYYGAGRAVVRVALRAWPARHRAACRAEHPLRLRSHRHLAATSAELCAQISTGPLSAAT